MPEFLASLVNTSDFPARWHCGMWTNTHGWVHVASDIAIFLAYMAIPVVIAVAVTKRKDIPFPKVFWLFVAFIAFCGTTHLVEAVIFWKPIYRVSAVLKVGTAITSWATIVALVPVVKQLLQLRSAEEVAEKEATLKAVLGSLSAGVVVADASCTPILVNKVARDVLDLKPGIKLDFGDSGRRTIFQADGKERVHESEFPLNEVITHRVDSVDRDLIVRGRGLEDIVIAGSARPVQTAAGFKGGVFAFVDVTSRVVAERNLARSNEDLESFAYAASHDLKEPLRQILQFSQLIEEDYADQLPAEAREYFQFISTGADRMQQLLQGLLDYSVIETRTPTTELLDLDKVLDDVQKDLAQIVTESDAQVTISSLPAILANRSQMRQLFQNLISNAVKFRGDDALVISVSISSSNTENRIHFVVKDNGIGIAPSDHNRVTTMFGRLHTRDKYTGNGIGLALCKKIVDRTGGEFWIESELGQGTEVHFTLPRPT